MTNVRVLNGGYQKWMSEGRPLTTELPIVTPTQYRTLAPDASLRVSHEEVQASIGRTDCVLLDVRTPQEYHGELFLSQPPHGTERAGHIPSAVHIDHKLTLNEDGTFKSMDELQVLYSGKGITADKEVFPYCAIGGRSGYTWFVLKYLLGYPNVRNCQQPPAKARGLQAYHLKFNGFGIADQTQAEMPTISASV